MDISKIFMEAFMESPILNGGIFILAVVVLVALCTINSSFKRIKKEADNAYRQTKSSTNIKARDSKMAMGYNISFNLDIEKFDSIRKEYNDQGTKYMVWSQMISIFPLLGLLGTVYGLMPGLAEIKSNDMSVLYSALSTALISTFLGLVASIILKVYVSFGPDKTISDIENTFQENDRRYRFVIDYNNSNSSEE